MKLRNFSLCSAVFTRQERRQDYYFLFSRESVAVSPGKIPEPISRKNLTIRPMGAKLCQDSLVKLMNLPTGRFSRRNFSLRLQNVKP